MTEYQLECYFDSHPCIHLFEQPLVYYDMQTIAVFIPAAMQEYKGSDYVAICLEVFTLILINYW